MAKGRPSIAARRQAVWRLKLEGAPEAAIALELGLNPYTVHNDILFGRVVGAVPPFVPAPRGREGVTTRLDAAARARGISSPALKRRLWRLLYKEPSLIDAILDDGVTTRGPS